MLLDSPEINSIEQRFISLYDRTLKRGIQGNPKTLKQSLKKQFKSATFKIQLDKILDDLCLFTVKYTDSLISEQLTASTRPKRNNLSLFASREALPLTEEAVRQSVELSEVVAESIIRTLKDEGIYQEGPRVLARRMLDLWGGEKYRAERFARTFSADVATSTTLHRYKQQGIEECQFYATIDSRTSPQCRMLHGTVYTVGSPESMAYVPPCHPHCRSVILPLPVTVDVDDSLRYENRNFEKPVSQNFKPLKDELDKDLVKGTFKNIDKFNDNYRIDKFILDEDLEKRLMRLGVGIEGEVPKAIKKVTVPKVKPVPVVEPEIGLKYVPAKTVKDAEEWLLKNTSVKYTNLKGLDIDVVNDMVERYLYHIKLEPKISNKINFYGTAQAQNDLWYKAKLKDAIEQWSRRFPDDLEKATSFAKRQIKKPSMSAYAHSWKMQDYDFSGIALNKKFGGDRALFITNLQKETASKWNPIGCDTPKYVFDHEFGHIIDDIYNISKSDLVNGLYKNMNIKTIESELSRYAATNRDEFVAEAWAEYLNNPAPRPVAKEIGDLMMQKIKEGNA